MEYFSNTSLAVTSRDLFTKKINQLVSFMPPGKKSLEFIIDNPEIAEKIILNEKNITQTSANRHMFYSAVVAYLKHTDTGKKRSEPLKNRWIKIQKDNWEERRQQSINNEPTTNQQDVAQNIDWSMIQKKRDELTMGSPERLLLSLYTYLPPVRADYFEVKINLATATKNEENETNQSNQSKENFVILDPTNSKQSFMVLRDFKTAGKYKEIKHELPEPLFREIQQSLKVKPRKYLFVMQTDATKPYDRGAFSKWANKVLTTLFGVPMTLTSLRHLYVSTIDFNKTRASDLEKIGNSMGHSIAMQKGYQWIANPTP